MEQLKFSVLFQPIQTNHSYKIKKGMWQGGYLATSGTPKNIKVTCNRTPLAADSVFFKLVEEM